MKPLSRSLLWTTSAAALLALTSACGDDEPTGSRCGEPLYGGDATDEAWRALVDARDLAKADAQATELSSPQSNARYAFGAAAPTWTWDSSLAQAMPRSTPSSPLDTARTMLATVGEWLLPTAHAHLPPFTGDIYWVQVTVPGRECPVEMLTSNLSWQLDAATWDTLKANAGKDLSVQVLSAYLLQNRIQEGPYLLAQPVTFRIEPETP
ncbi:hypothetical protein LXT21_43465 [Myxococcus sp. K38C18041901]|uniref:hypothetical protein n=1 Tax=Myxococcus guangdongensis TaxID=2906760 RepID=UPI0020A767D2|nr:hypothetical protein [Myxococcus guangdongensis]MCP3065648.1 hypothetical protein [Myxococcus guangdongensis]